MTIPSTFEEAFAEICQHEGRLSERLEKLSGIISHFDRRFSDAYGRLVSRLQHAIPSENAPAVGTRLPEFLLPDQHGHLRKLSDFLGKGPLVVSFNRGHWCEYCQLELRAFAAAHEAFAAEAARVISIMPERSEYTQRLFATCHETVPILTDMDNAYALELDLVVWLGDEVTALLRSAGIDLCRSQGGGTGFVPVPATFVLNRLGTIRFRYIDPDFRNRAEIETVLAAVAEARSGLD